MSVKGDIAIVGGGICGLSLALNLHRLGIACRVYERAPQIKELGVGITLLRSRQAQARVSFPECRPRFFQPAAKAHGRDAPRQAGGVIGLDRKPAQCRRAARRLEARA